MNKLRPRLPKKRSSSDAKEPAMPQDEKLVVESLQDPKTIKTYLQSIIDGIDRGRVILSTEDDEMVLYPGSLIRLTVKGKKKAGGSKLIMAISWKEVKKQSRKTSESIPS